MRAKESKTRLVENRPGICDFLILLEANAFSFGALSRPLAMRNRIIGLLICWLPPLRKPALSIDGVKLRVW